MTHNNWFKFKQFTVWQNHAAMRVGTDAVLLGTFAKVEECCNVLDIGTGTGVVALIVAQRSKAIIDAIDLDEGAIYDAKHNFELSPWKERLNVQLTTLQHFVSTCSKKYDAIVCNPPFFNNSEKSKDLGRKAARHTDSLSFEELAKGVSDLLLPNGKFWVVLPASEEKWFVEIALGFNLYASIITRVKPNPVKPPVRVLIEFALAKTEIVETELTIETNLRHHYTPEFKVLVKDFYLNE